jgi:hypothetical protein
VRLFLAQAENIPPDSDHGPILDPFAGGGTVPIECARLDRHAIGVEALDVLCFLARACAGTFADPLAKFPPCPSWPQIADRLIEPIHRAALILAVSRQHDSDGRPLRAPISIDAALQQTLDLVRADLASPLPRPVDMRLGDARILEGIESESVAGMLTSPPYLSRHDYTRVTRPLSEVYAHWYPAPSVENARRAQVRAHPHAHRADWSKTLPSAVGEAVAELADAGEQKLAGIVRSYFEDMSAALETAARVLRPDAPVWMVIGGARLADVYVPSDLILAEISQNSRFEVRQIRQARFLARSGRRLGRLDDIAPRESLLILRRAR